MGEPAWRMECVVSVVDPKREGGQQVGACHTPVKVEHTPTGTVAICGHERSQHKNKIIAMDMIEYALVSLRWPMNGETV